MIEDYSYRRSGRSSSTATLILATLGLSIIVAISNIPLAFIAPLLFMSAIGAHDFITNPTYGIDIKQKSLTVLQYNKVIELSDIDYVKIRTDDGLYSLIIRLTNRRIEEIESKNLPYDRSEIQEELEARGVEFRRGFFW